MEGLTLPQRFRRARKGTGETQGVFAKRFGVTQSTVARWESGKQLPEDPHLVVLADLEGDDEVTEGGGKGKSLFTMIPMAGYIGAGAQVYKVDAEQSSRVTDYVKAPRGFGAVESLRVRGNSMWPAYRDGDLVFIENRPSEFPLKRDTDYIVELADGRSFLKMVEPAADGTYNLISYNGPPEPGVKIINAIAVRYLRRAT